MVSLDNDYKPRVEHWSTLEGLTMYLYCSRVDGSYVLLGGMWVGWGWDIPNRPVVFVHTVPRIQHCGSNLDGMGVKPGVRACTALSRRGNVPPDLRLTRGDPRQQVASRAVNREHGRPAKCQTTGSKSAQVATCSPQLEQFGNCHPCPYTLFHLSLCGHRFIVSFNRHTTRLRSAPLHF